MSTDNDNTVPLAMFLAAGVVAAVIAGVIAVAVSNLAASAARPTMPAAAVVDALPSPKTVREVSAAAAAAAAVTPVEPTGAETLYFAVGSPDLPADASEKLVRMADLARANVGTSVVISGYHDATGGAAQNAELARRRAAKVRHALEADGVAPERLQMSKPVETTAGTDPKDARRVEIRLR